MQASIDEDIVSLIIDEARRLGADYAEARMEALEGEDFMLKNGNPEVAGLAVVRGISTRVLVGGALGFASTNQVRSDDAKEIAGIAVRMAKAASKSVKKKVVLSGEAPHVEKYEVGEKTRISSINPEDKLDALMEIDRRLPDGVNVPGRFYHLETETREKLYMNSDGSRIQSLIPRAGMFAMITVVEGSGMEQMYLQKGSAGGWENVAKWNMADEMAYEAQLLHDLMTKSEKSPNAKDGPIDLVCGPEVTGIAAHESCGHPYEADRIMGREAAQAGESFIKLDMLGQRIGSEAVSVIDDPTLEGSYGYYLYDDEGVKARARHLIKDGLINDFLHNRETAGSMGRDSNGSARSVSFTREPIVRMANTYIDAGSHSLDELFEGIKLGVYLKSFTEWNIDDKRYNQKYVGREAYLIKDGELGPLIKYPILEITTPGFYEAIDACGKEMEFVAATCGKGEPMQGAPVWIGGPNIRLRGITLGGDA